MGESNAGHICFGLLLLLNTICITGVDAQEARGIIPATTERAPIRLGYRFDHIGPVEGLNNQYVLDCIQDSIGFIWVATESGLARYDGYSFKYFQHDPDDPHSLRTNTIFSIHTSSFRDTSFLWLRTHGGLDRLNIQTEKVLHFHHDPEDSSSIGSGFPRSVHVDGEGKVWSGHTKGLDRFDHRTESFEHFLPGVNCKAVHPDANGIIWVGVYGVGLLRFDPETGQSTQYSYDPEEPASISSNAIESIAPSYHLGEDYLWIGMEGKTFDLMDKRTGGFQKFETQPMTPGGSSEVKLETRYSSSPELWLVSYTSGFRILNLETGEFSYQVHDPENADGLLVNLITGILEDRTGLIWLSSFGSLERLVPNKQVFEYFPFLDHGSELIAEDWRLALHLDSYNQLWMGGQEGIDLIDLTSGVVSDFGQHPSCPPDLVRTFITNIMEDSEGAIWITSFDGLFHYDPITESFKQYLPDTSKSSISTVWISTACEDVDGGIWIAAYGVLERYDRGSDGFIHHNIGSEIFSILNPKSAPDWIFAGTKYRGLVAINRFSGEQIQFKHDGENHGSLASNSIYSLFEDREGLLWIATTEGLHNVDLTQGVTVDLKFNQISTEQGLPDKHLTSVLVDHNGHVWVGSQSGLCKYDPESGAIRVYEQADGLPHTTIVQNANAVGPDGFLYFSSARGIFRFHPDSLKENPHVPNIVFTDFQLFHKPVPIVTGSAEVDGTGFFLPRSITYLDTLGLSYQENVFSLEFAALDFHNSHANKYAYMLEGFDEEWIFTDANNRRITYTNLDPGEYIFKVKGSNNSGVWNNEGRSLTIIISPPWWQTDLAYATYILVGLCILTGLWLFQLGRIRLRHQMAMERLRSERFQELDELKSRFFTNISHEFRTPLTLILGPLDKWRRRISDRELKQDLTLMQKHTRRVLELVTQLLDMAKMDAGKMKLQASERNVVPLLKGLVLSFASLADRRSMTLSFHSNLEEISAYVEKEAVVKIINNLLSNAFKFTPDGGEISVEVINLDPSETAPEGELIIRIQDTGIGIPEDQLESIFHRFNQVDSSETRSHAGTGIGLALTRELVEMHKGRITIESKVGEGSVFNVMLPLGRGHLDDDEIIVLSQADEDVDLESAFVTGDETEPGAQSEGGALPQLLIVEDNPDVRKFIRSYLDKDYRCLEAVNGVDGLEQVLAEVPDLIISDIMMPEMDGVEFCERIKKDVRTSHIPVILLTAKADLDSKLEGLKTGVDDYLTKPFEAEELLTRVENLIQQRRQLRDYFHRELDIVPDDLNLTSLDEQFLRKLLEAVNDNLSNREFNVGRLANLIHLSRVHLNRKVKALTGSSTSAFIRSIRLKRAAILLQHDEDSITQIAYEVGFSSSSHFSRAFRDQFGKSPKEYISESR